MTPMRKMTAIALALLANPALAATGPFVSLHNTNFVVLLGFLVFVGILLYYKVPAMIGKMLDGRAETIRTELAEARALRDEAQALLATYERKQREVAEQADRIVTQARDEATRTAAEAKETIRASMARRLAAAEDRITSAQNAAVREVRDRAVTVAIAAAQDVLSAQMTATQGNAAIDDAIAQVQAKLH
jgi:F-type H+-transporting ATPase subunit b